MRALSHQGTATIKKTEIDSTIEMYLLLGPVNSLFNQMYKYVQKL